ncbi:hypothetical protein QCA50_006444 [Cerrena zonata]|uniref:Terpenoid synthase n=1 Tax=Cerrena zonata TaxID=2478898 RepID=A0AAW0G8R7_9APHY
MREFIPRICSGEPQSDPILVHFLEMAGDLRGYLPDYTANMVHMRMMTFANEKLCGWKDANQLALKPEAGNYIEYSRYKNGISEPYAACIWPTSLCPDVAEYIQAFPDTLMFINYVNDSMSFYKEVLEEDEGSYVSRYGQLNGKTFVESVDDLVEKIISTTERIRKILGEGQARECWEDFASGFVHFGLFCPRYRWKEVVPEYF